MLLFFFCLFLGFSNASFSFTELDGTYSSIGDIEFEQCEQGRRLCKATNSSFVLGDVTISVSDIEPSKCGDEVPFNATIALGGQDKGTISFEGDFFV